ncbi:hypothetical protein BH05_00630 [Thermobifida fusca]|nr:hypothetical protein BH05_00630 [Thermobifida fusca]
MRARRSRNSRTAALHPHGRHRVRPRPHHQPALPPLQLLGTVKTPCAGKHGKPTPPPGELERVIPGSTSQTTTRRQSRQATVQRGPHRKQPLRRHGRPR